MEIVKNLTEGKPLKLLFLFAMPMILGNLFQQLYNMVDSMVVGKFVGEDALAAVGSSFPVVFLAVAIASGLSMGCTVVISQLYGAGQIQVMKTTIFTALILLGVIGLGIMGIGELIASPLLKILGTDPDIMNDSLSYLRIYFGGAIFLFLYNTLNGIYNALGDSNTPLRFLMVSALTNIGLDLLFVIRFDMGVAGVAWATLIAQGISAVISFLLLMRKLKGYPAEEPVRLYSGEMAVSMVKIAVPSTLQQSIVHIGILLVQSVINSFGSTAIAGYSAGMRIESLSIVPMLAMGNAMSTFTAQNMGAGKIDRVKEGYRMCYVIVLTAGAVLCVMYQLAGGAFVSLFLDSGSSEAYSVGLSYVKFLSFFYSFIGLKASTDGLLRGAGDVTAFTVANLVNLAIRVSVTNLFAPIYGIQVAWMAVPLGWAANYVISFGWYLTGKWKKVRVIKK